jgi:hypothetical protein
MTSLERGQFVMVGPYPGVVVALFGDDPMVPEEHVGIWYGQTDDDGVPKVRTVPKEYAVPRDKPPVYYH